MNSTSGTDWPTDLAARLGRPWTNVRHVTETGSTNADLAAAARSGAPGGTVLVAGHQAHGRGRLDRTWTAPPGTSLAISVLLRPDVSPARWTWLPLLAGIAVVDALGNAADLDARLKWPNDVLLAGGKVCGILAERVAAASGDAVVIGMGINTVLAADQLPVPTATSLALAGADIGDVELVSAVLTALGAWYGRWLAGEDLAPALASRCATIGREVRVELPASDPVTGTATGIDAEGRLLVRTAAGLQAFSAGDVVHLR